MKNETIQALIDWLTASAPKTVGGQPTAETLALVKALTAELPAPATPPPVTK